MIGLLLIAALLQLQPNTVMTSHGNDRMTSEAFRGDAVQVAALLAETADEEPMELPVMGGMALMTRGYDGAGRAALLFTPVAGTGARQGWACRVTEIRSDGQDNTARAIQWCRNVLGTGLIARQR
jgi:hypothetical protein